MPPEEQTNDDRTEAATDSSSKRALEATPVTASPDPPSVTMTTDAYDDDHADDSAELDTTCLDTIRELDAVEDLESPDCFKTDPPKSNDATGQEKEENENSPTWKERLILFYNDNEFLIHVICVICLARGTFNHKRES
jgi:hypothetical protein